MPPVSTKTFSPEIGARPARTFHIVADAEGLRGRQSRLRWESSQVRAKCKTAHFRWEIPNSTIVGDEVSHGGFAISPDAPGFKRSVSAGDGKDGPAV
jgi:hypothetical protein